MLPVPTFMVIVARRPMSDERDVFSMGQGCSIEDVMLEAAHRAGLPPARFASCLPILDDQVIIPAHWSTVRPNPGQTLLIVLVPGLPALPLVFAAAAAFGPAAMGLAGIAATIASAAISIFGALVMQALSPTPKVRGSTPDKLEPAVQSIQGISNEASPYGPIARLLGRLVSYYPARCTNYYTDLSPGNQQFLHVVFSFGDGPFVFSDLKIGVTPIAHFEGVTVEIREGYATDRPLTIFPDQVREQSISIELLQINGYSTRRSEIDTDAISIDIVFPNGLQRIGAQNAKFNLEVEHEVQYKATTSSTWLPATLTTDGKNITMSGPGRFTIRGNTKASLRRTVHLELPSRGRYDVKVRRLTTDDQSTHSGKNQTVTSERGYWTVLRSHRNEDPFNLPGVAKIALKIRASDQLNGVVDQFNCTVQALLPVWNGSTWTTQVTRSPAWAYCEVLRGASNARPVADSRIDLDKMLEWDAYCTDEGITYDAAIDAQESVYDVLQGIAGTANASVSRSNGPFSVVIDNERDMPVQHFTPRNSWGYASSKIMARRPHALKVRFPNERTLRQWDEIYVYEAGYSAANATLFETLDLPFTTVARQAYLRARRALFMARLRPEIHTITVAAEHLACTPGDLVRFTHDVPLLGVGAARVLAIATSGADTTGVTLDAPMPMDGSTSYAIRFRLATGDTLLVPVDNDTGSVSDFTFTTAVATVDGPAVGDLALFGESGSESAEMIVRSIEPQEDLSARITLLDYSPEIFTSGRGVIPEFDPQITIPAVVNRGIPAAPGVTSIASDEAVLVRASDGTLTSRILLGIIVDNSTAEVPAEEFQVRYRPADTDQDFEHVGTFPATVSSVSIAPVDDGTTYEIELRTMFAGVASAWVAIEHTVIGKTTPPPDVERMYRRGDLLIWPYPDPPVDHAGFLVRANYGTSQDWGTGRALHEGVLTASSIDISKLDGTQTVMVKAVDTSAIEATTAASVTLNLGDVATSNVILTQSEAPSFAGTITGGTVSGGVLEADVVSSPAFWGDDAAAFWGADSDPFWRDTQYSEMTYIANWTPTSDQLGDGILKLSLDVTGDYTVDFRIATSAPFWGADGDPFWGADGNPFWAEDTVGEFMPWPGLLGPFDTIDNTYEVRVTVRGGAVQGVITTMDLMCDVPDIVEEFEDFVTAPTTGTRLTLTNTFRGIKTIQITRQDDGGTAVRVDYFDKQANPGANGGPLIKGLSAAAAVVASTSSVRVTGW